MTRRRIVLFTIALLLLLDVGRSINARVRYAKPNEVWQPDRRQFADLTWPPGADLPATTPAGARIFAERCAVCHGPDGRGNGPAAPSMIPRPRDFTLGFFKYKSTPQTQPPSDEDLKQIVRNGLQASAMPYFRDLLKEDEIAAVVAYVKTFSPVFNTAPPPVSTSPPVPSAPASIERGRAIYSTQGCVGCHGIDGRKAGYLQDAKSQLTPIRDLTAPWTFRGGREPAQLWLRLTTGLAGSSMPSYAYALTPDERWDVVNYVLSIARPAPWEAGGKLGGPGQQADLLRRGEYLVHAEMCGLCHTQINRTGIYRDDRYLAGGMRVGIYPHGVYVSRNLTGDRRTGLGDWTEAQVVRAMRTGRTPTRLLNFWDMPWFYLHYLEDDDATAIARFLKTLPPSRNRIADPVHYGILETIASKVTRPLPAVDPTVLTFADGNFGEGDAEMPASIEALLIDLQWIVLAAGGIVFVLAAPRGRRLPPTLRGWVQALFALAGLLVLGMAGWVFYALPTITFIPPDQIVNAATAGIPEINSSSMTSEQRGLAERGRYLYKVASCAFCHNPSGNGGQKISWRPFGTLWTRNITADRETGIGAWSDAEIARAIRSGIARDGRVLHWQGMIWDHASNWDEEDLRSLIVYLRMLPPVVHQIPSPTPPRAEDCDVYTFWIATSTTPGCR